MYARRTVDKALWAAQSALFSKRRQIKKKAAALIRSTAAMAAQESGRNTLVNPKKLKEAPLGRRMMKVNLHQQ